MTFLEFNILYFEDKYSYTIENSIILYTYVTKAEIYECYSYDDFL